MTDIGRYKKITVWAIVLITLSGMALRLMSCFWGYPMALHPDELTVVDSAIDMLRRHSWLAYVYNRPDQFEIKCDAALFALASRILFGVPAYEAFETHYMAFYVIARGFTALFGTGMIPLAAVLAGRMIQDGRQRRVAEIVTAGIFAFSPILVEHSAYATPDIVLTFFVLLFALTAQNYLETGKAGYLWLSVLVTGIAVTIKYPAAILCIVIAGMVIYRCVSDRKYVNIVYYGLLSIALLLLTVFIIAPNLFTDFQTAYSTFLNEARPHHLGADGLGWSGNMAYYLKTVFEDLEPFSTVPVIAGFIWTMRHRSRRTLVLLTGVIYLVCISALSLHWIQWGIPVYVFVNLLAGLGVSGALYGIQKTGWPRSVKGLISCAWIAFTGVLGLNLLLSSAAATKNRLVEDTRSVSLRYCLDHEITTGNSVFEGYTPLSPNGAAGYRYYAFHLSDGKAFVNEPYATKQYFVTSDAYSGRFLTEREQYPDEAEVYRAIPESFNEIYRIEGTGGYSRKMLAIHNIPYTFHYFGEDYSSTGSTIYIYDLNPERITIETAERNGLGIGLHDGRIVLNNCPQSWVVYKRDNGKCSLLCAEDNRAFGCDIDGNLITVDVEAENECEFDLLQRNDGILLVSGNIALTREGKELVLKPVETDSPEQEWIIVPAERERE